MCLGTLLSCTRRSLLETLQHEFPRGTQVCFSPSSPCDGRRASQGNRQVGAHIADTNQTEVDPANAPVHEPVLIVDETRREPAAQRSAKKRKLDQGSTIQRTSMEQQPTKKRRQNRKSVPICGMLGCNKNFGHLGLCSNSTLPPRRNCQFYVHPSKNDPASPGGTSYRHASNWRTSEGARVSRSSRPSTGSNIWSMQVDLIVYNSAFMRSPVKLYSSCDFYVDLVRLVIIMACHVECYEVKRRPHRHTETAMTIHEVAVIWQLCYLANITWTELYDYFKQFCSAVDKYCEQLTIFNIPINNTERSVRTNWLICPTVHADLHPELRRLSDVITASLRPIEEIFLLHRIWHYQLPCPRLQQRVGTGRHALRHGFRPARYEQLQDRYEQLQEDITPRTRHFEHFLTGLDAGITTPRRVYGPALVLDPPFELFRE